MRIIAGLSILVSIVASAAVLAQSLDVTVRPQEHDHPEESLDNVYIALGDGTYVTFSDYIRHSLEKFSPGVAQSRLHVRIELGHVAESIDEDGQELWARFVPAIYGSGPVDERAAEFARRYYDDVPEFGRFGDGITLASAPALGGFYIGNSAALGLTPEGDIDMDANFAYSLFEKPYNLGDELGGGLRPQDFGYLPLRKYDFEK